METLLRKFLDIQTLKEQYLLEFRAQVEQAKYFILKMFRIKMITKSSTYSRRFFDQTRVKGKWRPAFDDFDCFFACDPTAMYVGELDGKPIGTCCIFKYDNGVLHGSGYYIEEKYRKHGYGLKLYDEVVKQSKPYTNVTAYAQLEMVARYQKYFSGGEILYSVEIHEFNSVTAAKNLQEDGTSSSFKIKMVTEEDFKALVNYDKLMFGFSREKFLARWLYSPASHSYIALNDKGSVIGYIVARQSVVADEGYKIGPLFCEDISIGKALLQSVLEEINGTSKPSSFHIHSPIGPNPQVKEFLKMLESKYIETHEFMATNGLPKGRQVEKWFGVTSLFCG